MDIFQDDPEPIHAVEYEQHPEGIEQHKKDDQKKIIGMLKEYFLGNIASFNLFRNNDVLDGVYKKEKEDNN